MRGDAALQRARRRCIPFEFSLAAGSVAMIIVALIDSAAFTPNHTGDRLAVMAAAIGVFSVVGGWQSALPVAAVGYLLFDGFLASRYGELTWNHQTGPHAIGVIALAVALGLIAGWLRSRSQRAAPIIRSRLSDDKLGGRSGTRGGYEGRGAGTGRLFLLPSATDPRRLRCHRGDRRPTIKMQQPTTQPSTTRRSISIRRCAMADLVFVLLTIGLFALLTLIVKAVERL